MSRDVLSENGRIKFACYQCGQGHAHLEYANMALTFTEDQFLNCSECIALMRERLLEQHEASEVATAQSFKSLVM
jgi:hypothetical protein